jgi:hypothetical protein
MGICIDGETTEFKTAELLIILSGAPLNKEYRSPGIEFYKDRQDGYEPGKYKNDDEKAEDYIKKAFFNTVGHVFQGLGPQRKDGEIGKIFQMRIPVDV